MAESAAAISAGRKRDESLWAHYTGITFDSNGVTLQVRCKYCGEISSPHATRLRKHYNKKHAWRTRGLQVIPAEAEASSSSSSSNSHDSGASSVSSVGPSVSMVAADDVVESLPPPKKAKRNNHPNRQTSMLQYTDAPWRADQQRRAEALLVAMQLRFGMSVNSIISEEMKAFTSALRKDFRLPTRAGFLQAQADLHARVKTLVEGTLQRWGTTALAVDAWEDEGGRGCVPCCAAQPAGVGRGSPEEEPEEAREHPHAARRHVLAACTAAGVLPGSPLPWCWPDT